MNKLMVFVCISFILSCKKSPMIDSTDIIGQKWVLETAILDRPLPLSSGVLTSDYIAINGIQSCLANNYTLVFSPDGSYKYSSTGPLCDMYDGTINKTWVRENENTIILNKNSEKPVTITLKGNTLTYTIPNTPGVVYWAVTYTFKSK